MKKINSFLLLTISGKQLNYFFLTKNVLYYIIFVENVEVVDKDEQIFN